MTAPTIKTPRGQIVMTKSGKAKLEFDPDFAPKWRRSFTAAQKFVDNEVLRLCEPYVPLQTGMLVKSGILGTDVGSGTVQWIAPYAKWQYYRSRKPGRETGPLRGPYWFERMKETHGAKIIAGARRIAGNA